MEVEDVAASLPPESAPPQRVESRPPPTPPPEQAAPVPEDSARYVDLFA
jgi:hypothetical protein